MAVDIACTVVLRSASAINASFPASRNAFQHASFPLAVTVPVNMGSTAPLSLCLHIYGKRHIQPKDKTIFVTLILTATKRRLFSV